MAFSKEKSQEIKTKIKEIFKVEATEKNGMSGSVIEITANVNSEISSKEIKALEQLGSGYKLKRSGTGIRIKFEN